MAYLGQPDFNCRLHGVNFLFTFLFYSRSSFGEGTGNPLQYSCLENPMGGGAWWAAVHGVAKSWTLLSDFTFTLHFYALEKDMATHSGVLAWRIPGTEEPGGLPSMGSHRVGHDWSNLAAAAAAGPHWLSILNVAVWTCRYLYYYYYLKDLHGGKYCANNDFNFSSVVYLVAAW